MTTTTYPTSPAPALERAELTAGLAVAIRYDSGDFSPHRVKVLDPAPLPGDGDAVACAVEAWDAESPTGRSWVASIVPLRNLVAEVNRPRCHCPGDCRCRRDEAGAPCGCRNHVRAAR